MTTLHPDCHRPTRHRSDKAVTSDTFTVRLPRWRFARLFGRNPLVHPADRVEALVVVLALVMALVAVPIAAAVGTAVYDSRSRLYAEQAQNSHVVTAIVTDHKVTHRESLGRTVTVLARWLAAGTEHTGSVSAPPGVKTGNSIDIWVGEDGSHVGPPPKTAYDEAVAFASLTWLGAAIAAAALIGGTRAFLNRFAARDGRITSTSGRRWRRTHRPALDCSRAKRRSGHTPEYRVEDAWLSARRPSNRQSSSHHAPFRQPRQRRRSWVRTHPAIGQDPGRPCNTAWTNSFRALLPYRQHDPGGRFDPSLSRHPLRRPIARRI
jgi:hypothetical protein